jgi:uncharacterized protein YcfL
MKTHTPIPGSPLPSTLTRRFAAGLFALALTLAGTGCNTTEHQVNTVEPANPAYVRRNIEDRRIVRDSVTAKAVAILNVIDGSTPDGLARIGVEVQNQRKKTFRFNYRFDWFDAQGFPVGTPATTMISQQIEGGQILTLISVAPHPGAKDFRLTLQESTRDYFPVLPKN